MFVPAQPRKQRPPNKLPGHSTCKASKCLRLKQQTGQSWTLERVEQPISQRSGAKRSILLRTSDQIRLSQNHITRTSIYS
ncbi:MAG: hypothetical protein EBX61_04705 [Betaproteobacteria bacterium]|nr:hypothetical protein [Betaproteobacteria bacterium]NDF92313.1 hypothetical protein [Betaproteobacteria bacterium]NDG13564.1 hypothetical protein [Betaproteobacteria bacterium]